MIIFIIIGIGMIKSLIDSGLTAKIIIVVTTSIGGFTPKFIVYMCVKFCL